MEKDRTFTYDEVLTLISYTKEIVFDAVQAIHKKDPKSSSEEVSQKALRKWGRLLAFPELIIKEQLEHQPTRSTKHLGIQEREILYQVLGNTSPRIKSMDDKELLQETLSQLKMCTV